MITPQSQDASTSNSLPRARCAPRGLLALTLGLALVPLSAAQMAGDRVTYARDLALSPDARQLAFSWAGDIWTVGIEGGVAKRLTVHPAIERHPVWSPDGLRIAFSSGRHGAAAVYTMTASGGDLRRLTFADRAAQPTSWSAEGDWVIFHSRREAQREWDRNMYQVPAAGGQPKRLLDCLGSGPTLSPDGRKIAFTRGSSRWFRRGYRGSASEDAWIFDRVTGSFEQVTDFPAPDQFPVWDGNSAGIFVLSNRDGYDNVWHEQIGRPAHQVTRFDDADVRHFDVARDGSLLVVAKWDQVLVQDLPAGAPRAIEIFAPSDSALLDKSWETLTRNASEIALAPDGKSVALVVHGEIYVVAAEPDRPTRRVTRTPARDQDVYWSPDGRALYFVSDRTGTEQIFRATVALEKAAESNTAADSASDVDAEASEDAADDKKDSDKKGSDEKQPDPPALHESLRFVIEQVTEHRDPAFSPQISPDGKHLAYARLRGDLIIRELATGEERLLLPSWNIPVFTWSPDSKWLALSYEDSDFNSDVWMMRVDGSAEPINLSRHPDYDAGPQFSADGRVLAFTSQRHGFDTDLYMVFLDEADEEKSRFEKVAYFKEAKKAVDKLKPAKRVTASGPIALVGLPAPTEAAIEGYLKPDKKKSKKKDDKDDKDHSDSGEAEDDESNTDESKADDSSSSEADSGEDKSDEADAADKEEEEKDDSKDRDDAADFELDTAYQRIRRVTRLPANQSSFALHPAGGKFVFVSSHAEDAKVYSVDWDGDELKRLFDASASQLHWTLNGKRFAYRDGGVPKTASASGGDRKTHGFRARLDRDFVAEARQKWDDGSRAIERGFYHPTLKGLNWRALSDKHRDLALTVRTNDEFRELFNRLLGELNGSHLGMFGGDRVDIDSEALGYLGLHYDPAGVAADGLRVTHVVPRGPADRDESRIYIGDVITTVNGEPIGATRSIHAALLETVNEPVLLEVQAGSERIAAEAKLEDAPEGTQREVVIRPIGYGAFSALRYDEWVQENRAYVEAQSQGRVGYVHIQGMNEPSFETFERDLYAAAHGKDGLIIDVRNNGGGWTADWVMNVLSVRRHSYTIPRGGTPGYPQGRLIFYAWTKPATMMCNQYSFSNAEIVSHAFKNLERGPLVGMPTFGGVISTGAYRLIDNTLVRMPFRGWYTLPHEVDMEVQGAEPTVRVPVSPQDEVAGRNPQLKAAVEATLDQLGGAAVTSVER